jgi:DNA-binding transcriptional LysR family regulator
MTQLNFDMDALRTLVVGVELGGFSHAAARLNRSPSAVSMQLRKLETQAGQQLLKRNGRGLTLTEAGDLLLQYARRVLALNDEMGVALGAIAQGGTVRVGMPQDLADVVLPGLLARYCRARPTTHVEVRAGRNYTLMEDVANGRLDLALAFVTAGRGGENRIATVPTVWIGRAKLSKAERYGTVGADGAVSLVVFDGPCLFRDTAIEALARARLPWRLAMTTPSLAGVCCGVRAGLGVTVRTRLGVSKGLGRGLAVVPPDTGLPPLPSIDIVLRCTQKASPAVLTFRELLVEVLRRECLIGTRVPSTSKKAA